MDRIHAYARYARRAESATCVTDRTVSMLGMMCAAAADNGVLVAFVGRGTGGNWPDPRESQATEADDFDPLNRGYGVNFPAPEQGRRGRK